MELTMNYFAITLRTGTEVYLMSKQHETLGQLVDELQTGMGRSDYFILELISADSNKKQMAYSRDTVAIIEKIDKVRLSPTSKIWKLLK